jgi:hypothetical protein
MQSCVRLTRGVEIRRIIRVIDIHYRDLPPSEKEVGTCSCESA